MSFWTYFVYIYLFVRSRDLYQVWWSRLTGQGNGGCLGIQINPCLPFRMRLPWCCPLVRQPNPGCCRDRDSLRWGHGTGSTWMERRLLIGQSLIGTCWYSNSNGYLLEQERARKEDAHPMMPTAEKKTKEVMMARWTTIWNFCFLDFTSSWKIAALAYLSRATSSKRKQKGSCKVENKARRAAYLQAVQGWCYYLMAHEACCEDAQPRKQLRAHCRNAVRGLPLDIEVEKSYREDDNSKYRNHRGVAQHLRGNYRQINGI